MPDEITSYPLFHVVELVVRCIWSVELFAYKLVLEIVLSGCIPLSNFVAENMLMISTYEQLLLELLCAHPRAAVATPVLALNQALPDPEYVDVTG